MLEKEDTTHLEFVESNDIALTEVFDYESTQYNMNILFFPKDWSNDSRETLMKFEEYITLRAYQLNW